ncbi:MAG: ABC transporter permease subunit [Alphaproteobacteria bacterium]|nr:ABC transporter permease subunit [Alphaproteobacteria bacterium]
MLAYVIQRVFQSLLVMVVVAFAAFIVFNFVGDPVDNMLGQETSAEEREELRKDLGLDDPFIVQFGRFVTNAVHGEFGISYRLQRPVADLIAERMPATLELVALSAVLALVFGVPLGVFTGINRSSWISQLILIVSLVGVSLPTFVIGILLIYIFAVNMGVLPSFGRGGVVEIGWWSTSFLTVAGWQAIILPAVTLSLFQMTLILRLVRSEMLEVMRTDYIKFARARGLTDRAVNFGHALRNTLVPVITIVGLNIGSLVAFSIITETVFQWPGMGFLFIQAVGFADVPVMAAYLVMIAFVFVMINLIVDLLYFVVDPRLRADKAVAAGN